MTRKRQITGAAVAVATVAPKVLRARESSLRSLPPMAKQREEQASEAARKYLGALKRKGLEPDMKRLVGNWPAEVREKYEVALTVLTTVAAMPKVNSGISLVANESQVGPNTFKGVVQVTLGELKRIDEGFNSNPGQTFSRIMQRYAEPFVTINRLQATG